MILLNGNTEIRMRSSDTCTVNRCGCAYVQWPSRWLQMCDEHGNEWKARHDDAMLEHATAPDASAKWMEI